MDENDWDLMAVVRSCNKGKMPSPSKVDSTQFSLPLLPPSPPLQFPMTMDFPDLSANCESVFGGGGLEAIVMPFHSHHHHQQQQRQPQSLMPKPQSSVGVARTKNRKKQQKKVVTKVPVESSNSNDNWAWRKYGQKPIKGSPFPRGYYRCSTSKNCPARKQVEKSWADPGMFIITYTDEHNHALPTHRNSLAGTTRSKLPPSERNHALPTHRNSLAGTTRSKLPPSSNGGGNQLRSNLGLSPITPLTTSPSTDEEDEDEDGEGMLQVEDMQISGEDELVFLGDDASTNICCKTVFDAAFFDDDDNAFL